MTAASPLYVYGIVHADRVLPPHLRGVGRPPASLGQVIADGLERRAVHAADGVVRELAGLAEEWVEGAEVPGCVRNTSFLMRRADAERCAGLVADRAAGLREWVELRLTGPLPCYSFVDRAADRVPAGGGGPAAVRGGEG